jgi:hypothetical protein
MKSKSCICLGRPSSEMEAPIPVPRVSAFDTESARPRGLVRKNSKLQTHVEVLRCRLGKQAATIPEDRTLGPSKDWTPIYYAVYHQREAALAHFLQAGGSPDDVDGTGQPPLCIAVANGSIEIVKVLLEAGANVDATTRDAGETALHIAIKNNRSEIIDILLESGPELEAHTTESHETPLHYAASKSGSLATIVSLLKLGAKYDTLNSGGQSPAEAALKANNIQGAIAIINAARGRRNKLVKEKEMLLKHVERSQNRFSIGNELIADIFAAACDPDSTVLVEAIKRNDAGLVEMFLGNLGADPDRETAGGDRPIFVALECAGASVVQTLVNTMRTLQYEVRTGLPFFTPPLKALWRKTRKASQRPLSVCCPRAPTLQSHTRTARLYCIARYLLVSVTQGWHSCFSNLALRSTCRTTMAIRLCTLLRIANHVWKCS